MHARPGQEWIRAFELWQSLVSGTFSNISEVHIVTEQLDS